MIANKIVMKNRLVIFLLVVFVITYNIIVYTSATNKTSFLINDKALLGEGIWQENNCAACHQFYGLGGYLGPDLTNIISNKGRDYAKAFFNSGIKSMPKFNFTDDEKDALASFLEHVDSTGYYPDTSVNLRYDGWVEINYK